MYNIVSLAILSMHVRVALAAYSLRDDYMNNFFDHFDFFTGDDPTHGYVNYVDAVTAQSAGYARTNVDGTVYIGVDFNNVTSGRGRDSIRISSKKVYTHMLVVADIYHMPGGICGVWPAFWSFGNDRTGWPYQGEIDIIEGANDQEQNYFALHSSSECAISHNTKSLLQSSTQNCNSFVNGNVGCSFRDSDSRSYGPGFNVNGGGIYAAQWNSNGVSIWFFPRGEEPADVLGDSPFPQHWGPPTANWEGDGCDWDKHFISHNLIFDTTFCGDWADNTFEVCSATNNGQTCRQYVQNNPFAFEEAYWQIGAFKVYQESNIGGSFVDYLNNQPVLGRISTGVAGQAPVSVEFSTSLFKSVTEAEKNTIDIKPPIKTLVNSPLAATLHSYTTSQATIKKSGVKSVPEGPSVSSSFRPSFITLTTNAPKSTQTADFGLLRPVLPKFNSPLYSSTATNPSSHLDTGSQIADYAPVKGKSNIFDPVEETHEGVVYDEVGVGNQIDNMRIAGKRPHHRQRHLLGNLVGHYH